MNQVRNEGMQVVRGVSLRLIVLSILQFCVSGLTLQADYRWFTFDDGPGRNSPFVNSVPKFSDFYQIFSYAQNSDPYSFTKSGYPPFGHEFLTPLSIFTADLALMIFLAASLGLIVASVFILVASAIDMRKIKASDVLLLTVLCLSFPVMFALNRGNVDLFIIALLIVAVELHHRGRYKTAAVVLGAAIAIKLYPVFLLIYFVRFKNGVKFALLAGLTAILATLFAIWQSVGLSKNSLSLIIKSVFGEEGVVLEDKYGGWSTSATGFIAALRQATQGVLPSAEVDLIFLKIRIALILISLILSLVLALLAKSRSEAMLGCVALALLIPSISYHYKAALLIIPILISIQENSAVFNSGSRLWALALAFGPTAWWFFGDGLANTSSLVTFGAIFYLLVSFIKSQEIKVAL